MDSEPFIFENRALRKSTPDRISKLSGHYTFVITEGPRKGETFDAKIGDFHTKIPQDLELIMTPNELFHDKCWD